MQQVGQQFQMGTLTFLSEYHALVEGVVYNTDAKNTFRRRRHHSAVWMSEHLYESNKDLLAKYGDAVMPRSFLNIVISCL